MADKISIFDFLSLLNPDAFRQSGPPSIQNGYEKNLIYDEDRKIYEDPIFQEIIHSDFVKELESITTELPQLRSKNIFLFILYARRKDTKEAYEYLIQHLKPYDVISFLQSDLATQKAFDIAYIYYQDHYVFLALPVLDKIAKERGFTSPQLNVYDVSDEILIQVILETDPVNFQDLAASSRRYANLFRRQDVLKKLGIKYTIPIYSSLKEFLTYYYDDNRISKLSYIDQMRLLKKKYSDKMKISGILLRNNTMPLSVYSVKENEIAEFISNVRELYNIDYYLKYMEILFQRAIYNREDISSELAKIFDSIDESDDLYEYIREILYQCMTLNITRGKQLIEDTIGKMLKTQDTLQKSYDDVMYNINILLNEDFKNARDVTGIKEPWGAYYANHYHTFQLFLFHLKDEKNMPTQFTRENILSRIPTYQNIFKPYL